MLSRHEIESRVQVIANTLSNQDCSLCACAEVDRLFSTLRDEYRRNAAGFSDLLDRLAQLRKLFDEILASRVPQIIDHFHEVNEQIRRAEEEKAVWRDFLIRIAVRDRRERLTGTAFGVRVRSLEVRQLPGTGTPAREQLESIVRAAGCWDQVSQLSKTRLEKAMSAGQVPSEHSGDIDRLCPVTVIHQVSSQPLGHQ